ncbi:porin family protein [Mangrovimonas yunxiaonensis]|nr:porin family protein [Mangrovimonas yunxiaonensis]GGH44764.1 hypothetical protein GCM10011364_17770 [Mangrovimonas yunxiaonensis]
MMKFICLAFFCLFAITKGASQEQPLQDSIATLDKRYKEDQFYFAVTYNLMAQKPNNVSQTGFSSGFHLGGIKDMPINKRRNVALGLGLGLARNAFNHNLLIAKTESGKYEYLNLSESDITHSKNRLINYLVELPLEFRWRTSTAESYKFWRIYTGVKLGYSFYNVAKYEGSLGSIKTRNLEQLNKFQYGLTLSFGYNTWNFHIYYALNPMFNDQAYVNDEQIAINEVRAGLIFYIL